MKSINHFTEEKKIPKLSLLALFEEQVKIHPQKIALASPYKTLTFEELNEEANKLSCRLKENGIQQNSLVALKLEDKMMSIIGMLSVWKACGAFLPLDISQPEYRLAKIIENSKPVCLVTAQDMKLIDNESSTFYKFDVKKLTHSHSHSEKNRQTSDEYIVENQLAYVIYTSGTTGSPKGVMVGHDSLSNYFEWLLPKVKITEKDNAALLTSVSFDLSYTSLFSALISGASLYLPDLNTILDPRKLIKYLSEKKITYIKSTPSLFQVMFDIVGHFDLKTLRLIIFGGEQLERSLVQKISEDNDGISILNHYGPTESTIGCIANFVEDYHDPIPIGKPINNVHILILDNEGREVEDGEKGELYVGGKGLALGYINNLLLTKEKFINNPKNSMGLIYKTGDLVRKNERGEIEFLGRDDGQAKIRGYRVETKEVERAIQSHDLIGKAVVMVKTMEDGINHLIGYYTSKTEVTPKDLMNYLLDYLPSYMIPSKLYRIEKLPLTMNGKLDVRLLEASISTESTTQNHASKPSALKEKILQIWKMHLYIDAIDLSDDFFEIGGHSLAAMKVANDLSKELNVEISVKDIFQNSNIDKLATYVEKTKSNPENECVLTHQDLPLTYPASSEQIRLYTISKVHEEVLAYNLPILIKIEGEVSIDQLKESLKMLVRNHESLRTTFSFEGSTLFQIVHSELPIEIEHLLLKEENVDDVIKAQVKKFNLESDPLFRFKIYEIAASKTYVFMDFHHVIVDGVSLEILLEEFKNTITNKPLKRAEISYRDYTKWQNDRTKNICFEDEKKFWINHLDNPKVPHAEFPLDYERPTIMNFNGTTIRYILNEEICARLTEVARSNKVTLYMLLLSAYSILLSKYGDEENVVIGAPINGRTVQASHDLVGMVTNTLVLKFEIGMGESLRSQLKKNKNIFQKAIEYQNYPFDQLLRSMKVTVNPAKNPLFDSMFAYQEKENTEFYLGDSKVTVDAVSKNTSKFDNTMYVEKISDKLILKMEYNNNLYEESTMRSVVEDYVSLLEEIVENDDKKIKDYLKPNIEQPYFDMEITF